MNMYDTLKKRLLEVAQPISQGEKNFKSLHDPKFINLVPGVTDQEHVFKGTTQRKDPKTASYEDGESVAAYDRTLKTEAFPSKNNFIKASKFGPERVGALIRGEKQRLSDNQKKIARVAGHPGKIDAADLAALRSGKKITEDKDQDHFGKQSQKMQDAINMHLRKGKDYAGAVKAAKVHVKEETRNTGGKLGDHQGLIKYTDSLGMKHVDRHDLLTAASHMAFGNESHLAKHVKALDTDVRDKVKEYLSPEFKKRHLEEEVEQIDEQVSFKKTESGDHHIHHNGKRVGKIIKTKSMGSLGYSVRIGNDEVGTETSLPKAKESAKYHLTSSESPLKEQEELDEAISKMSDGRLKWHINTGVPHGSYTKDEMKKERDHRLKTDPIGYRNAKPAMKEEVELDEVSKDLAGRYIKAAKYNQIYKVGREGRHYAGKRIDYQNREKGIDTAIKKLTGQAKVAATNEEAEQIDELSRTGILQRYSDKTRRLVDRGVEKPEKREKMRFLAGKKRWGSTGGIASAKVPATNEEAEQIDELKHSGGVLDNYLSKTNPDRNTPEENKKRAAGRGLALGKKWGKALGPYFTKITLGINQPKVPATNEESDYIGYNFGGQFKDSSEWENAAKKRGLVVKLSTHPSGEVIKYQIAKDKSGNNRGHFDHGTKSGRLTEEAEHMIREDDDWEGQMAKTELSAIREKSSKLIGMLNDQDDLEAWVQSKISQAKMHIDSVHDYLVYGGEHKSNTSMPSSEYSQSGSMASSYGNFMNRMGEGVETEGLNEASDSAVTKNGFSSTGRTIKHRGKSYKEYGPKLGKSNPEKMHKDLTAQGYKHRGTDNGSSIGYEHWKHPETGHKISYHRGEGHVLIAEDLNLDDGDDVGAKRNIINQLRKRSQGDYHVGVGFANGKKADVHVRDANKILNLHLNAKTAAEKEAVQAMAGKSHEHLKRLASSGKPDVEAPKPRVTLGSLRKESMSDPSTMQTATRAFKMIMTTDADGRPKLIRRKLARKDIKIEELVGGQKNLDKNRNGKLDKMDFKLLRKKMSEAEEMTTANVAKAAASQTQFGVVGNNNMQQDSVDKMKSDPLASKQRVTLPPTQGNKPIGGDTQTHANVAEEIILNKLYDSLSEENKVKFDRILDADHGIEYLLNFAREQGV